MLLSLINRPSFSGSACTVPVKKLLLESGLGYENLRDEGNQYNAPNLSFRTGINNDNELLAFTPDYIKQSVYPYSGSTPVWLALKSRIYYDMHTVFSVGLTISPPSGNASFGSPHTEFLITPIFYKIINSKISYQVQTGVSSSCDPSLFGGNCYRSFNPDFVVNYNFTKKFIGYIDFYTETKTDYFSGSGLLSGGGLLYLIKPTIALDVEYYHRVYGHINYIGDFYGIGISKLLSL